LHEAVFSEYSPLASNAELARRMLTPLSAARIPQLLARAGKGLSEQPINPAEEKFVVYVPAQAPPAGYALLVFVPPWTDARLPEGWSAVLDRYGVIFVSAARSGNDATPLGRRVPLALTAAQNAMRLYRVDPQRVYVGGFSGGSRTALRLALGYPDLFRGALLNAGSDPIGSPAMPLPPKDLLLQFQNSTRLVYVTGDGDAASLAADEQSTRSMREWCVFDIDTEITHGRGHEAASPAALSAALHALFNPVEPDPNKLAACREAAEAKLAAQFQKVESLIASGRHDSAQKLLHEIDARFGGIAAPRSLDLAPK
jgi:pimeloyl-ACP methyl ester carboxylesterase